MVSSRNAHFNSFKSSVLSFEEVGNLDAFVHQGLGWMVKEVKVFSLNVNELMLFFGGEGCSSLPLCIKRTHSCISIGSSCDDKCFLKCVVAALCDKG